MSLQKANITTELEQKSLIEEKEHLQNGKFKDNYNKDRKLRCFNYNIYKHMAKDCRKLKKEKEMRKYYKYDKVKHLTKNCRTRQKIKNTSV